MYMIMVGTLGTLLFGVIDHIGMLGIWDFTVLVGALDGIGAIGAILTGGGILGTDQAGEVFMEAGVGITGMVTLTVMDIIEIM